MDEQLDRHKYKELDIALTEYHELRTESRESAQIQITIVGMVLTAFGVLGGLGVNMANGEHYNRELLGCVFFVIIPAVISFGGLLWLDQAYRRYMLGVYLRQEEKRICQWIDACDVQDMPLRWEQWFYEQTRELPWHKKTNYYYYYITLGVFIGTPIASMIIGGFILDFNVFSRFAIGLEFIIGLLALAVLVTFTAIYCFRILKEKR